MLRATLTNAACMESKTYTGSYILIPCRGRTPDTPLILPPFRHSSKRGAGMWIVVAVLALLAASLPPLCPSSCTITPIYLFSCCDTSPLPSRRVSAPLKDASSHWDLPPITLMQQHFLQVPPTQHFTPSTPLSWDPNCASKTNACIFFVYSSLHLHVLLFILSYPYN